MKVYQFNLGTRPVVTLCGEARDYPTLIRALDTSGPKRRVLRLGLLLAARIRLIPLVAHSVGRRDFEDVQQATGPMCRIAMEQGIRLRSMSVVWPVGDRTHRRYVLGIDASGEMRLFSKVTTAPDLDWHLLHNEGELLGWLTGFPLPRLRTPRLYRAERDCSLGSLVMEAIPARRQHLGWPAIQSLLPLRDDAEGPTLTLEHAPWLERSLGADASRSFRRLVAAGLRCGATLGLTNGDIRPSNVVSSAGYTWLFDWEYGARDAPERTDEVAALLNAKTSRKLTTDASEVLVIFLQDIAKADISVPDSAVCLLYLSTVDHPWAKLLMHQHWPEPHRTPTKDI